MRLKHSSKKNRIVKLAAQRMNNKTQLSAALQNQNQTHQLHQQQYDSKLFNNLVQQNTHEVNLNMENSVKSIFKQCKIKQIADINKHSPTNSDFEYIQSVQNFKNYLKKTKRPQIRPKVKEKKITQTSLESKPKKQNHFQSVFIQTNNNQQRQKRQKFKLIQQKIQKVKNLSFKYNSQREFQNVYEQIYNTKPQQQQVIQKEYFQLVSIRDYLKFYQNSQLTKKYHTENEQTKNGNNKLSKRSPSREAKRWYHSKTTLGQKKVDPQSLIQMIKLDNSKRNSFLSEKQKDGQIQKYPRHKTFYCTHQQNEKSFGYETITNINFSKKRPKTAPNNVAGSLKIQSYLSPYKTISRQNTNFTNKKVYMTQKVKGLRHIERQKYGWKEFKNQIKIYNDQIANKKHNKTQLIFQYPWNKKTKSFSINYKNKK